MLFAVIIPKDFNYFRKIKREGDDAFYVNSSWFYRVYLMFRRQIFTVFPYLYACFHGYLKGRSQCQRVVMLQSSQARGEASIRLLLLQVGVELRPDQNVYMCS